MKRLMIASLLALASTSAIAADVVYQQAPVPEAVSAQAFSWSGPYLGVHGGGGWLNGDFDFAGAGSRSEDFNGGLFGAFVGYNFQFDNNVVLGVEGNLDYNWNDKNFAGADIGTDWSGAVRGRVGYAFDRALVFAAGGWTATRGFVDLPGAGKSEETFNGWTVGAGVDYAFTDMIFGRAEYRYNDFGDKDIQGFKADLNQHTVTVGVGVKF
jgi:outer membrane immunogenic protein